MSCEAPYILFHSGRERVAVLPGFRRVALELFHRNGTETASAGRGRIRRIPLGDGEGMGIVRHLHRGGMFASLLGDRFADPHRPVRELLLSVEAREAGAPVPETVAARTVRCGPGLYRGDVIVREVEGVSDLLEWIERRPSPEERHAVLRAAAEAVRRLHAAGVDHVDLNLRNILVGGDPLSGWAIDLDRCRMRLPLPLSRRIANLRRLARSVEKRAPGTVSVADRLRFIRAYAGGDRAVFDALHAELRRPVAGPLRRLRWRFGERSKPTVDAGSARITAATYTLNNEGDLEECLASLGWADEVIAIDSGSTDGTVAIARRFTEKVYHRDWTGFRDQLEQIQERSTGDWVLVVDADERVTPELAEEIRRIVADPQGRVAFAIPRTTRYLGRWLRHGDFFPDYTLRLYRRGHGRYVGEPHARLVPDGPAGRLKHPLKHLGYRSLTAQVETTRRYAEAAAAELDAAGCRRPVLQMFLRPPLRFLRSYFLRLGFLDGRPGLVSAGMTAFYVYVKYARIWERRRRS